LLQNLLDWASTQTGKTILVKEKVDLSKVSQETIALLTPVAKGKNIKLQTDIPKETFAFADKNMVSTVLLNLVTNAIKFTPQNGKVDVHSIEKNKHLEVEVADTGIGISDDNLKKIFRLDHKFQMEGTEKEKGTGLGLILCKEFVEKNSGKIWVKSKEGKGSQFYFSLPVPKS
jgi:signal transduction histidine kinase